MGEGWGEGDNPNPRSSRASPGTWQSRFKKHPKILSILFIHVKTRPHPLSLDPRARHPKRFERFHPNRIFKLHIW